MAWTNPRTWVSGEVVTAALLNTHLRDNLLAGANEMAARRVIAADQTLTNPTTFTTLAAGADRTALTTTFTKQAAGTSLIISVAGTVALSSGVQQLLSYGLRIGGTDYAVAQRYTNSAAATRVDFTGYASVTGLAAGALTIEPVFLSSAASNLFFNTPFDWLSYTVRETR